MQIRINFQCQSQVFFSPFIFLGKIFGESNSSTATTEKVTLDFSFMEKSFMTRDCFRFSISSDIKNLTQDLNQAEAKTGLELTRILFYFLYLELTLLLVVSQIIENHWLHISYKVRFHRT